MEMEYDTRCNWPLHLALLAIIAVVGGYVVGWPLVSGLAQSSDVPSGVRLAPPTVLEQLPARLFEALIAFWFFLLGASVGSFLNVVVFRTPRGWSLLGSSFCPKCGCPIRWSDNLPVFGWLRLRGRCRDCGLPIAGRYPLVELLTGLIVLGVAIVELFLEGANLPGASAGLRRGASWLIIRPQGDLIATFVYHTSLLCILFSWALIRWDGFRLPRGYVLLALLWGLALPVALPVVHPVPWSAMRPEWLAAWSWRIDTAIVGGLVGSLLGAFQGAVASVWATASDGRRRVTDLAASYALVGVFLGWQAVISVAVLASSTRLVLGTVTGGRWAWPSSAAWVHLALAAVLQILAWNALDSVSGWPGTQLTLLGAVLPVALSQYFALVAGYVERRWAK
jgi:leader peptidase (prepilin peptidase) / N-methyltransferase